MGGLNGGLDAWGHRGHIGLDEYAASLMHRIVEEVGPNGAEKWFEVGFISPTLLAGDASVGWVNSDCRGRVWLEWSEDLVNWDTRKMVDCARTAIPDGEGNYEYWARSSLPQDSQISIGQLLVGDTNGDARNTPITALTILDVAQTLPNFPYTMPADSAQLQTDLRAAGWAGATVTATAATTWTIAIPNVAFTAYYQQTKAFWPGYYVADMFGSLTILVDGISFDGQFVNSVGTRTKLKKQFVRMGVSGI